MAHLLDPIVKFLHDLKSDFFILLLRVIFSISVYVETGKGTTAATISIAIAGTTSFSRKWKIKVSTIECENPMKAPA